MLFLKISELPVPVPECQKCQTAAFSRVCSALAMSTSFAALCSSQSWSVSVDSVAQKEQEGVDQNRMEKKIESVADDENLWMTNEVVDTARRINEWYWSCYCHIICVSVYPHTI